MVLGWQCGPSLGLAHSVASPLEVIAAGFSVGCGTEVNDAAGVAVEWMAGFAWGDYPGCRRHSRRRGRYGRRALTDESELGEQGKDWYYPEEQDESNIEFDLAEDEEEEKAMADW